ncbi:4-aminobutyrate--2-oxoglutarate transaminase [Devosia naphthalenivorans]|uniref:4-aminobutyrate--2-oxoglutarate transaminase n=1 Tax=Devosia naphthalenivorans TaxID=2082392 RepID=UPI000D38C2E6|nr:4-aminobutyrate--2-oxoglutarate transaminase [Devosia naphthalenivorans]
MLNSSLHTRRQAALPRGLSSAVPFYAGRAENAELWDEEGNRYIDFAGGIAVLNTGHRHPKVVAAIAAQLERFTHTAFQIVPYAPYVEVCERLNAMAPISGPVKSVLFSTGAEAVENAVKIARAHTRRPGIIAFAGAFHGRTNFTMTLTGKVAPYRQKFGIGAPGVFHLPFPAPSHRVSVEDSMRALMQVFRADIAPEDVAAIIIEPVQGEGGFLPAPIELLQQLRSIADQHGILLIADEIQTGFARTGKMFGIEHAGVEPDLITVAKSLAGGMPLSGVIGKAEVMDAADPGGLGGTYAGNPLACAAALAVLDIIAEEGLVERANHIGARIRSTVEKVAQRNDAVEISGLRGPGAMVAFDITSAGQPDAGLTRKVIEAARREGLILLSCGVFGNTIRILNPLTISDAMLDEGLGKLESALIAAMNP